MDKEIKKQIARRKFEGVVVTRSGDKTVCVRVDRVKEHPKYRKHYKVSKKFLVHDEKNQVDVGDHVRIAECRPYSSRKRWVILEIIKKI